MIFSNSQIQLAIELKSAGLPWHPHQGQYAFDVYAEIKPDSPFQQGVYYFLDFPCFVDYFGSVEQLARAMAWLPTFEEARGLLRPPNDWNGLATHLDNGTELDFVYRALLTDLKRPE